jgi:hypothetical protein
VIEVFVGSQDLKVAIVLTVSRSFGAPKWLSAVYLRASIVLYRKILSKKKEDYLTISGVVLYTIL